MNSFTDSPLRLIARKQMLVDLLDKLCQNLEVSPSEYLKAKRSYQAVGEWLIGSNNPLLNGIIVYPHGSIALGTAIKPVGRNDFDVDLVSHLPASNHLSDPFIIKQAIGDRLYEHGTYRNMLEEKQRCWRLNYENEFHMDITPSVINPLCKNGGELVPDKQLSTWKPTNPKGYINQFQAYATMSPAWTTFDSAEYAEARGEILPLPDQEPSKPILNRIVQLLKRHRDHTFIGTPQEDFAPISIIITTLASWAYVACIKERKFVDHYDLILEVIRKMPTFINKEYEKGRLIYSIPNETTTGENFADKWNRNQQLPYWFFDWHKKALLTFEELLGIDGLDRIVEIISNEFSAPHATVQATLDSYMHGVNRARENHSLRVNKSVGILSTPSTLTSVIVPQNTFFGRPLP